jgi:ribonuclease M5
MINLKPAIVVEGRYDKNKLSQIFDTVIIEVGGFGLFKNDEKMNMLRRIAETRGLVVLTDSDGAGLVIRNRIKSCISNGKVYHAYVPDVIGKEKRKNRPSKEGKLGVEGMPDEIIIEAVKNSGAMDDNGIIEPLLTKERMYELGLSGKAESKAKRAALIKKLNLPENLSANALIDAINALGEDHQVKTYLNSLGENNV